MKLDFCLVQRGMVTALASIISQKQTNVRRSLRATKTGHGVPRNTFEVCGDNHILNAAVFTGHRRRGPKNMEGRHKQRDPPWKRQCDGSLRRQPSLSGPSRQRRDASVMCGDWSMRPLCSSPAPARLGRDNARRGGAVAVTVAAMSATRGRGTIMLMSTTVRQKMRSIVTACA